MKYLISVLALVSLVQAVPAAAEQGSQQPMTVAKFTPPRPGQFSGSNLDFRTEIKEKYQFYDVSGTTANEIRRQMNQNGTKWDDGRTYDALTTWEINYRFSTAVENGRCYISSAKTDVGITFRYPRWTNASTASADLTTRWNRYMQQLRVHEDGHRDLAVSTAREINDGLNALGNFPTCAEAERTAKTFAQTKLAGLQQIQRDYDSTTQHGETQGAVFP